MRIGSALDLALAGLAALFLAASLVGATGLGAPDAFGEIGLLHIWPGAIQNLLERLAVGLPLGALFGLKAARSAAAPLWVWAFAAPFALAVLAEAAQLFAAGRHARTGDVLLVCAAQWAGALLALAVVTRQARRLWPTLALQAAALAALTAAPGLFGASLVTWDCATMRVAIGDEIGGGRPWLGAVRDARLTVGGQTVDLLAADANAFERICRAARRDGTLRLAATIVPGDDVQEGPARIITFSRSTAARNFTLGQSGDALDLRVRTVANGPNGSRFVVRTPPLLRVGEPVSVLATYAEGRGEIWVDGALAATARLDGRPPRMAADEPTPFHAQAHWMAALILGLGAATALALTRQRRRTLI